MIKGGIAVMLLSLAAMIALQSSAFSYAGIVKLNKTAVLNGVTEVRLFSGAKPNQTSAATLVEGTNYSVDNTNDPTYRIYNIYDAPGTPAWLLLLKGTSTYSIISGAMGTTVPPTTTYDSAKFYTTGIPEAPTGLTIEAGYESAKATWSLNTNDYEIYGVDVQVAKDAGFSSSLMNDKDGNSTTALGNQWNNSNTSLVMSQFVDGRTLEAGTTYYIQVRAKVDGVDASNWTSNNFTMKSGGGPLSVTLNLQPGLNSFSLGIPSAAGNWYGRKDGVNYTLTTVQTLVTALGGASNVSTFGYVTAGTSGAVTGVKEQDGTFAGTANFLAENLRQTQGYQIYIKNTPVIMTISNTAP